MKVSIAITTRNRYRYLDATLKSLSGSNLPEDVPVTVYDDASDDGDTLAYYQIDHALYDGYVWTRRKEFLEITGGTLSISNGSVVGISNRVTVNGAMSQGGVNNNSRRAISSEFHYRPNVDAVILLQDDMLFKLDWFSKMLFHAGTDVHLETKPSAGQAILSGCNTANAGRIRKLVIHNEQGVVSSTCILIHRKFWMEALTFFGNTTTKRIGWDGELCRQALDMGYEVHSLNPAVAQHIGIESLVRPNIDYYKGLCRINKTVKPPYAFQNRIRNFPK